MWLISKLADYLANKIFDNGDVVEHKCILCPICQAKNTEEYFAQNNWVCPCCKTKLKRPLSN